jgi:hypothetical protein
LSRIGKRAILSDLVEMRKKRSAYASLKKMELAKAVEAVAGAARECCVAASANPGLAGHDAPDEEDGFSGNDAGERAEAA